MIYKALVNDLLIINKAISCNLEPFIKGNLLETTITAAAHLMNYFLVVKTLSETTNTLFNALIQWKSGIE